MANPQLRNPHLAGESFLWEAGPVGVLLMHGLTATTAEVRQLAQRLHAAGYTVAGPLLPGHGTTPEDLNRVRWQDWVRAAEEAYEELAAGRQKVFVGGESMGAVVALYLASERPEAAGITCYAPAFKLPMRTLDILRLHLFAPFVPAAPKGKIDVEEAWQGYPVNPLRAVIELLRLQRRARARLSRISQPVLIIQGRLDQTIDPQSGALICQDVRSAIKEQHWMEHSTHAVALDRELDRVTDVTLRFMERALAADGVSAKKK